jgi:hypothetical protein
MEELRCSEAQPREEAPDRLEGRQAADTRAEDGSTLEQDRASDDETCLRTISR